MATALNLAKGTISVGAGAYGSIQPAAGQNWQVLSLLGGSGWFAYQGGWRVPLPYPVYPGSATMICGLPRLFISNSCYIQAYNGGGSPVYVSYQAQILSAGFTAASAVLHSTGSALDFRPSAGYVRIVSLAVCGVGTSAFRLTDGTNTLELGSLVLGASDELRVRQKVYITNSTYIQASGAAGNNVFISAAQTAATTLAVQTAIVSVGAGATAAFEPSAGNAWRVSKLLTNAAACTWDTFDGTNAAAFLSGAGVYLEDQQLLITNDIYLRLLNSDGGARLAAISAIQV